MRELYVAGVKDTTINSGLKTLQQTHPQAFYQGVKKLNEQLTQAKQAGKEQTFSIYRTVFWGKKE